MTTRKWLLLNSPNYLGDIARVLTDAGEELLYPVTETGGGLCGWGPHAGPPKEVPGAVCIDHNAGKNRFMLAGGLCGMGVPTVYLSKNDNKNLPRRLGLVVVADLDEFRRWLAAGPAQLRKAVPRAGV
jgi:hypothetical protein